MKLIALLLVGCTTSGTDQGAADVAYDNTASGLLSKTVQGALDDLSAVLASHEDRLANIELHRNVIVCRFVSASMPIQAGQLLIAHVFTAGECGGSLPDPSYVGAISRMISCSQTVDGLVVSNTGEADGPGVTLRRTGTMACTGPAEFAAVFYKAS